MATKFITPGGNREATLRNFNPQPGDIFILEAKHNPWSWGDFSNVAGTAEKPITITNQGGQVIFNSGIGFGNGSDWSNPNDKKPANFARHIKFIGTFENGVCGFKYNGQAGGPGCSIGGFASDIEVKYYDTEKGSYGFWIKNEADCDVKVNDHIINNIEVHFCKIRKPGSQGFYMGSTDPNNSDRAIPCDGVMKNYAPSRLGNISIHDNDIEETGRPAIQLSGASFGRSKIYRNKIRNVGNQGDGAQGTGISLGLYTKCDVYENDVSTTLTWSFASLGATDINVHDNIFDNSGALINTLTKGPMQLPWPSNIFVDTRHTIPTENTFFIIKNNQCGVHGSLNKFHIDVLKSKDTYAVGNIISGNTANGVPALVNVVAGIDWSQGVVTPPPTTFLSAAKSQSFTKNDCATGTGSDVTYNIPAGKYTSTISQADADLKATNDVIVNGQGFANANGTCVQPVKTVFRKGYFVISSKRYYYIMYTDGTWENKK